MTALVLIETSGGVPTPASLALLPLARTLGVGEVAAVTAAPDGEHDRIAAAATEAGADVVALATDDGSVLVSPLVDALSAAADELGDVRVVLAPASADAREAAARLAVRLGTTPLWDADSVVSDAGEVTTRKTVLWAQWIIAAGNAAGTAVVIVDPALTAEPSGPGAGRRVALPASSSPGASITDTEVTETEGGRPALAGADVVVAGGLGVGSQDEWPVVEELADALGAAVGATRSVVDEGWVPFAAQIGQTGEVVAPRVYLGLGISGAIQHTSGMQRSGTIIAINDDEDAPIFEIADLGVVGDVHDVVPALLDALRERGA